MSCYLIFHGWSGDDPNRARAQLAKMFRLDPELAGQVFDRISRGEKWKFENSITDRQAQTAQQFLTAQGFTIQRTSTDSFIQLDEPPPPPPVTDDTLEQEEEEPGYTPNSLQVGFHGNVWDLLMLYLKNWVLTICTLGIYYFWGKTNVRKYIWGHTSLADDRLTFHGTGKELLIGGLKFVGLILGLVALTYLAGQMDSTLGFVMETVLQIGFVFLIPILLVGAFRYRTSRTGWRGIRFSFRGERMEALKIYAKGMIFNFLTLGFYNPVFMIQIAGFWRDNTWFGNKKFRFEGAQWRDIFGPYVAALVATLLTLGLASPCWLWFNAYLKRYLWSHTHFENGTFDFNATGWQYARLQGVNFLILVFTLGLGYAWVVVRNMEFTARHLSLEGIPNWNRIVQDMQATDAISDQALDVLDIDLGVF